MKQKFFVAISSVIYKNKLVYLCSSKGDSLYKEKGIEFKEAIDFLFSLIKYRKQKAVFVCYDKRITNEYLFSDMSDKLKDRLFQSPQIKNRVERLNSQLEQTEDIFYNTALSSQQRKQADFERMMLQVQIKMLTSVRFKNYKITLRSGKMLSINKNGRSITFNDLYGFFQKQTLRQACNLMLDQDILNLDKEIFKTSPFYKENEIEQLKIFAQLEAEYIAKLGNNLDQRLQKEDINLTRYYSASCIISHLLYKWKAKKNYHNYRNRRQHSPKLWEAKNNSFYGGNIQQFKIGTVKDVKIYDINSAYAHAACQLPIMLKKPHFVREYTNDHFSLWECEFDFTSLDLYFGLLPVRLNNNQIKFPLKGKGWYWQPEVSFIMENYPQCVKIKQGFALSVEQNQKVSFALELQKLYGLRLKLKEQNNPLEKTIKEALSNINGRFAQSISKQPYYNLFYAGFITSFTRRQLLDATKGYEKETICFQTDAIHTTARLSVSVSDNFGDFKLNHYDNICYLDNGVYQGFSNGTLKRIKTRGLKAFDFENALSEMQNNYSYSAELDVFIGYNLSQLKEFKKAKYLDLHNISHKYNPPGEERGRIFEKKKINLLEEFLDSKPEVEIVNKNRKDFDGVKKYIWDSLEAVRV